MKPKHTDEDIAEVNRMILERRAERATPPAQEAQPTGEGQPRPAVDLSGLTPNDFRPGMPALSEAETADWIATYRAGYQRFAHDPQGEAIITLMEKRLAAALEADGRKLPAFSPEERLRALRIAAAVRGNGIR
jgi:hypothetical protein